MSDPLLSTTPSGTGAYYLLRTGVSETTGTVSYHDIQRRKAQTRLNTLCKLGCLYVVNTTHFQGLVRCRSRHRSRHRGPRERESWGRESRVRGAALSRGRCLCPMHIHESSFTVDTEGRRHSPVVEPVRRGRRSPPKSPVVVCRRCFLWVEHFSRIGSGRV